MSKKALFIEKGFDRTSYERYYHQHQNEYIRIRLRSVNLYSRSYSFSSVATALNIDERSVRKYVNTYLRGGYEGLVKRTTRNQPKFLTEQQEQAFKQVLLHTHPTDHDYNANIWTGQLMIDYIEKTYGVTYKSGIYDLLERLNLSHQRAHSDYSNADPEAQSLFLKDLENTLYNEPNSTALVFADEFSVCEKPSSYYGWAEKNTRPTVKTDEKKVKE